MLFSTGLQVSLLHALSISVLVGKHLGIISHVVASKKKKNPPLSVYVVANSQCCSFAMDRWTAWEGTKAEKMSLV